MASLLRSESSMQANLMLLFAAAIWGFGFVAQRLGMDFLEPFAFNGFRFLLGSLSLLPLIAWFAHQQRKSGEKSEDSSSLLRGGLIAGSLLFIAATLQQVGLLYTTAAKAGFITGLYLILVPIIGILLRHTTGITTWLGAMLAVVGLYLLSINDDFSMSFGDRVTNPSVNGAFPAGMLRVFTGTPTAGQVTLVFSVSQAMVSVRPGRV